MNQLTKGYCVLTVCVSGYELVWRVTDENDEWYPNIYETQKEAHLAIIKDIEEDIQQFKDDERDFGDMYQFGEYLVVPIEIQEDGKILVRDATDSESYYIVTTLDNWRKNL